MAYDTPAAAAMAEIEIKKSRFIAHASKVTDRQAGMAWLAELKAAYPDARHHCWAYLLGDPARASSAAMGDDGEPSGTAGKPILNVLQHKGVGDVMLVVVRYFGGIKLGAGGLTRAYGQAAQAVMEVLPIEKREPRTTLMVRCDFAQEQGIRHWLSLHGGQVTGVDYGQDVRVQLELPETALADWLAYGRAHGIKSSQGD
ncbi:MAG: YigZ family protein [Halothiobacillaceae bacterium]|jgi:uncharacterized YigZ family protein